jgi:hypothetical protein
MEIKHVRSMDTIGKKKLKEWESSFGKGVVEELSSKRRNIGERSGDEKEASKLV